MSSPDEREADLIASSYWDPGDQQQPEANRWSDFMNIAKDALARGRELERAAGNQAAKNETQGRIVVLCDQLAARDMEIAELRKALGAVSEGLRDLRNHGGEPVVAIENLLRVAAAKADAKGGTGT